MVKPKFTRGLVYVGFDAAVTPRDGKVLTNRYWVVHSEKGFAFFAMDRDFAAPQCNSDQRIAETIRDKMYPDHEVRFAEVVYMGNMEGS